MNPEEQKGVITWFARNPVAANLFLAALIVFGLLSLRSLKRETFPQSDSNMISVSVIYPGAAPAEVEEGICRRIEEAIQGLTGIKKITSSANEGAAGVTVEVLREYDVRQVLDDVKARVDAIDTFPVDAEQPLVQEVTIQRQTINIAVTGDPEVVDEAGLKIIADNLRDELTSINGITQVELASVRPYEVSVEVSEHALRRYGLRFEDVAQAIRLSSLDLPGGSVKTAGGEILIRSKGQRYLGAEFADLVLINRADGTRITVGDVATVVDGFMDTDQASRFDGKPAALVQVFRVGDQDVLEVAEKTKLHVAEARKRLPPGITLTSWADETVILNGRISLLVSNLTTGLFLVFLVLALFLKFRLAIWVALGIPISFLACVAFMPTLGVSVNMISLFAFIVVLGIVVDDAIVVGESVYTHRGKIRDKLQAAIVGTKKVSIPVTFGVLTTVAAFSPMLDIPGNARKIWQDIAIIVIVCLMFSLVESKLILPAHLGHYAGRDKAPTWFLTKAWTTVQSFFTNKLHRLIHGPYRTAIEFFLRARYLGLALGLTSLLVTGGWIAGGHISTLYFPDVEGDNVVASLTMPLGTPVEVTSAAIRKLELAADELGRELDADDYCEEGPIFPHKLASVGDQPWAMVQSQNMGQRGGSFSGAHIGEVNIQLAPAELRSITSKEIEKLWEEKVGPIADATELSFTSSFFSTGKDIDIQLSSQNMEHLLAAKEELKDYLRSVNAVSDISDSFRAGKQEVQLNIKPAAEALGISLMDLARQVRQGFYGEEVQRVQRGREDIKIMVRYTEDERRSLGSLEDMRIRTPEGAEVPFSTVATASYGRGYATIKRANRARIVNVTAEVDAKQKGTSADKILQAAESSILVSLQAKYAGLRYSLEGDNREQTETMQSLMAGFVLVLFVIYALMAIPFRSYLQPLIIMTIIPFGLVGAVWGHVAMSTDLSIMSMFGLVALVGVVVNDSLVLVDHINKTREAGTPMFKAVHDAALSRFRPIILTSLTTFASLTPLLLERSVQAKFLQPMAISLGFGVLFATLITLFLVPCVYLILEDVRGLFSRRPKTADSPA